MSQIQKFSLVYDPAEDRLACDTEATDGVTTRLWMTRRFCKGVVEAIIPLLEKSVATGPSEHQALVQSWEQAAAMANFGGAPAVQPTAQSASGLVQTAHLAPSEQGLTITFDFGAGDSRSMGLAFAQVRQMLSVMHKLHVAAGWPLDFWPAWVSDPAASAAATETVN